MRMLRNVTLLVGLSVLLLGAGSIGHTTGDALNGGEPPVCDANGPYTGFVGDPIPFDGTGSYDPEGGPLDYDWDFGDGDFGSGPVVPHIYLSPGMYTVTLCVIDDGGQVSCCTTTAEILNRAPICDAGGPYAGCVGDPITFDGTGSIDPDGGPLTYDWDFGDGNVGSGPVVPHVFESEGEFVVVLCVVDDGGLVSCCETTVYVNGASAVESMSWGEIKHLMR